MSAKAMDPTPSFRDVYLIFYNVFLSLGWLIVLIQALHHLTYEATTEGLWESTSTVLKIFQTLAVLEVVHAAVSLVPCKVNMVVSQVTSRLVILWLVLNVVQRTRDSIGLPMLLLAWSVTEVVRYTYYFLHILKHVPYILTFLRYSMFIVLYPVGVTGELLCLYAALPTLAKTRVFSVTMPNFLNFTFDLYYVLIIYGFTYIPGFPTLYGHMLSQRKKVLGSWNKKRE